MIVPLQRRCAACVLSFAAVVLLGGCVREATLLSDLSQTEAFSIQHVLSEVAVRAVALPAKDGRMSITVPREQEAFARGILLEKGLPRPDFKSFGDVFGNDGMLTSPFEERARYLYASSQGLENTLRNIEGVLFAKVHVVMPEARSMVRDGVAASASVFLKYRSPSPVASMNAAIQRLVANAIPGLTAERVVVVLTAVEDLAAMPVSSFSTGSSGLESTPAAPSWASHLAALFAGLLLTAALRRSGLGQLLRSVSGRIVRTRWGSRQPRWLQAALQAGPPSRPATGLSTAGRVNLSAAAARRGGARGTDTPDEEG